MMIRSLSPVVTVALAASLSLMGCDPTETIFPDAGNDLFIAPVDRVTTVNGYAYDPEAFFELLAECGPDCPVPPFIVPGNPLYENVALKDSQVVIIDPSAGGPVGTNATSTPAGTWVVKNVPSSPQSFFLPAAQGGTFAVPTGPGDFLYPGPSPEYAPTLSLRPVVTGSGSCILIEAALISKVGILEALAKYQTVSGTPTTVDDLLDPSKYGGVAIFWLVQPGPPVFRIPAGGTTMHASAGTALNINWAPPGLLPAAVQSTRGYFVDDANPYSDIGMTAVLLPADQAGIPVSYTVADGTTDPMQGRPWGFAPLEVPIPPGQVTMGTFNLYPGGEPPPDDGNQPPPEVPGGWFCAPG